MDFFFLIVNVGFIVWFSCHYMLQYFFSLNEIVPTLRGGEMVMSVSGTSFHPWHRWPLGFPSKYHQELGDHHPQWLFILFVIRLDPVLYCRCCDNARDHDYNGDDDAGLFRHLGEGGTSSWLRAFSMVAACTKWWLLDWQNCDHCCHQEGNQDDQPVQVGLRVPGAQPP